MKKFEIIKFKTKDNEIDIKIDHSKKVVWFTSNDLQALFDKDKSTISRQISSALKNVNQKGATVAKSETVQLEGGRKVVRNIDHYSLDVALKIAEKNDSSLGERLNNFIINYFDQYDQYIVEDDETIIYDNGELKIPVSLSVKEQTVYLTSKDVSLLFGTTIRNINTHIQNIIQEGELDINSVRKSYFHTANDGKKYIVNKYNLDMILAIGYRAKTKNAISFRLWVTEVLKSHMIKGYSINSERCIECKDALTNLANSFYSLKTDITTMFANKHKELAFEPGDELQGFVEVKRYLESAEKEILIIDNYFGHEFDEVLSKLKVKKTVITNPMNTKIENNENYRVIKSNYFHDRFIFVDDICYHFGTSPKDLGLHYSIAIRMQDFTILDAYKKLEMFQIGGIRHK